LTLCALPRLRIEYVEICGAPARENYESWNFDIA
jgi:hypothetical protein